jgi:hypothetical protein
MSVRDELLVRGFKAAGTIHPIDADSCSYLVDPDVIGFIVYAHVVRDQVKKFGTTRPSLKARVSQNANTINQVIALQAGRAARDARWHHRPLDAFKRLAPEVIKAKQTIEIWAAQSSEAEYHALERELNAKYETIRNGWASRLG